MSALHALLLALCCTQDAPRGKDKDKDREKNAERVVLPRKHDPLYMEFALANPEPTTPMLVLYHQARSSKGEYRPIVPRLKELGYNCLSVDLSSGGTCRDVKNMTAHETINNTYLDALPDMLDSLQWARTEHAHGKLVAWGSSYSASLALHLAAEHPELIDGVIAFSPGEYFTALGKSATWIQESVAKLDCPVFVAAARGEERDWQAIFGVIPSKTKQSFVPQGAGAHGSSALWDESPDHAEYWTALEAFLKLRFPATPAPETKKDK